MIRFLSLIVIILTIATLSTADVNAETHVAVRAGADFGGQLKVSALGFTSTGRGASCFPLSIELTRDVNKRLALGGGFEYQVRRSDFDFSPIGYGLLRYFPKPDSTKHTNYYLTAKVGHNGFDVDNYNTVGGAYIGLGFGTLNADGVLIEILYSIHYGTLYEYSYWYRVSEEARYMKFNITFGFFL